MDLHTLRSLPNILLQMIILILSCNKLSGKFVSMSHKNLSCYKIVRKIFAGQVPSPKIMRTV